MTLADGTPNRRRRDRAVIALDTNVFVRFLVDTPDGETIRCDGRERW